MRKLLAIFLVTAAGISCRADAESQMPGMVDVLQNPGFDESPVGTTPPRWTPMGDKVARAELVSQGAPSPPRMLQMTAIGRGSSGNNAFMLFQRLNHERFRGKRVRFGAKVRTDGAGLNIVLYTPERNANDFVDNLHTDGFVARSATTDVPANASFLSFAVQILGPAGSKVWVDDTFVEIDGPPQATGATAAPPVQMPGSSGSDGSARVEIDAQQIERVVSPLIFGMHLEWVDGGVGLLDPKSQRLRSEVLDLLRPLRIPLFRFPGGILADYYDWHAGAGPAGSRPAGRNVFTNNNESNRFGTPEFVDLLRSTGASALITANYGTGNAGLAGGWARELKAQGAPAPYWEVGNEIYLADPKADQPNGRAIYHVGDQYARDYPTYRAAITAAFPGAAVGAIAHVDTGAFPLAPGANRDWTTRMLDALSERPDFFAVHNAYAPVIIDDSAQLSDDNGLNDLYKSLYAAADQVPENLDALDREIARHSPRSSGVPYAVTEFGPFFGLSRNSSIHNTYVDQTRTLASAVYTASLLDRFIGDRRIFMAAYTNPIHKWYGSLLTDTPNQLVKTPTYYLYLMYRTRFERNLLPASIDSPNYDARGIGIVKPRSRVSELLARATISDNRRRLTVMLVSRKVRGTLDTTIAVNGFTAVSTDCQMLTAELPSARNGSGLTATTRSANQEIAPAPFACGFASGRLQVRVPASSVVSIVLDR